MACADGWRKGFRIVASMSENNWTKADYAEYEKQLAIIQRAYGNAIPKEVQERNAANIITKQIEEHGHFRDKGSAPAD